MATQPFRIFVSAVSDELKSYREAVAGVLRTADYEVRDEAHFHQGPGALIEKLRGYIKSCDVVIFLIGDRTGSFPTGEHAAILGQVPAFDAYRDRTGQTRASYTQWEYLLATQHGKARFVFFTELGFAPDGPEKEPSPYPETQRAFRQWVRDGGKYWGEIVDRPQLLIDVLTALLGNRESLGLPNAERLRGMIQPRNLPFASLGDLFKGRETFMADLRAALVAHSAAAVAGKALHGLGGVGKTRLAVEYAHRHAQDYTALLFVPAETPSRLETGLAALAGADILDLPEKEAREESAKKSGVLRWLDAHPGWLMILDNVDDAEAVKAAAGLVARLRGGHVLITGRAAKFPPSIGRFELGVLAEDPATEFLLARTAEGRFHAPDDADNARALAREMGGLALGLEQAGAYIANEQTGFAQYIKLWRETREEALAWFDKDLMAYDHADGLATTWEISVRRLGEHGLRLLERLAFFASEPIPESLLDVTVEGDGLDARKGRSELMGLSLISKATVETGKAEAPGFAVHRLVQDFTRRRIGEAREREVLEAALNWVNAAFDGDPQDVRSWPTLDPLAPHAQVAVQEADKAGITEPTARLMNQLGLLLDTKARHQEAEPLSRRALAIDESSYGPDHPQVAIDLNNLASLLHVLHRHSEAEPLLRRSLAIVEAAYGLDHPRVAIDLNNLAELLRATNRHSEAEPLSRRALAIDEVSHGPDHPRVATSLNTLANLLGDTNRLTDAEPLYRRALAIDESSFGPDHPRVAIDLNNLAELLRATNRHSEAEPLYRRALSIGEANYGPDHPRVAIALSNLALLLNDTNRHSEAEPLYRRALSIDEASYGPDHPNVAMVLSNLAALLFDTNRHAEAEPLFRRALSIDEASYGPDHPNVARDLNNLALLLRATNRLSKAEPLFRRALAIDEASYGRNHPSVAIDLNNLSNLLAATNRLPEAEPLSRRMVEIFLAFTAQTGHEHPHLSDALKNYARILRALDRGEAQARAEIGALLEKYGLALE